MRLNWCMSHSPQVFDPDCSQAKLYNGAIAPIVEEVLEGFNCTIFAYGQTGTGKTYTMEARAGRKPYRMHMQGIACMQGTAACGMGCNWQAHRRKLGEGAQW